MKLYTATAPSPLRVEIFLREKGFAERGVEIPHQRIDVLGGEARREPLLSLNSLGETPVLSLDDGSVLTESVAICRYLEALHPEPALFGAAPREIGLVEMWNRRMEIHLMGPIGQFGRHRFPLFADRVEQMPAYAESQLRLFDKNCAWLDREMRDGRPFVAGEAFSVADITGMAALIICDFAGHPVPESCTRVKGWEAKMRARESWPQI